MKVPSRTAHEAATHRAAHQLLEHGRVHSDPLALRILGEDPDAVARAANAQPRRRQLRIFIAARQRFAEDTLALAVERGVRQLVVLGAGLDTFAYRNPYPELSVLEVDHPATQAWKRERLARAEIAVPLSLRFAPIDFERQTLAGALSAAGFDGSVPTFFMWLGVVVYLSDEATWSTLRCIADVSGGSHVVFDYSNPPATLPAADAASLAEAAARMAASGEPWINYLDTASLLQRLRNLGYDAFDDLGASQICARYLPERAPPASDVGPHFLHAAQRRPSL
jgi:methyltransferase (TIGR00027 family)